MLKRVLFLVDAVRAFRAGQTGRATDPRMRIVMSAINAWRDARRSGSGGHRSTGTAGFVMDALRAFRASRSAPGRAAQPSRIHAILEAVRAYRATRPRA